jgi:hydrogenase maturation protease
MGDDGLGLAALEQLRAQWRLPPSVELVDGGTWGLNLLPVIEDAGRVLLIDAIDTGGAPGTLHVLEHAQIPRYLATKISPHEVDLRDVLALAELRGTLPRDTVAIGLQPAAVTLSSELSDVVRLQLDDLVTAVTRRLAEWGHPCEPALTVPCMS